LTDQGVYVRTGVALLSPFYLLSRAPQPAQRTVLWPAPTNAFSGIWQAARQRNAVLGTAAGMAVAGELMPILLSNVPFRETQAWQTHVVCSGLVVGIVGTMWLVVAGSFGVQWPHMPVDPRTIAGAMFYVCDSRMLSAFEGLGVAGRREVEARVGSLGLRFELGGDMVGMSGRTRIGVDALPGRAGEQRP